MCTIITSSHNTEWYVELWILCERSVVICGLCVAIFGRREQLVLDLFPDARVWDVESGKTVLAIETGLSEVEAAIYSPDMTMIGTGGESKDLMEFINIWDAKTGKLITNLKGHTWEVFCLAWTADGSTLISGSMDYSIMSEISNFGWNILKGHGRPQFAGGIAKNPENHGSHLEAAWKPLGRLRGGLPRRSQVSPKTIPIRGPNFGDSQRRPDCKIIGSNVTSFQCFQVI